MAMRKKILLRKLARMSARITRLENEVCDLRYLCDLHEEERLRRILEEERRV